MKIQSFTLGFIVLLLSFSANAATSSASLSNLPPADGVSVFKFQSPKSANSLTKPIEQNSSRLAIDSRQSLEGVCPVKSDLIKADCEASTRGSERPFGEMPTLQDGMGPGENADMQWVHTVITKTVINKTDSGKVATCKALNARPDEVVKLSMSVQCMKEAVAVQDSQNQNVPIEK